MGEAQERTTTVTDEAQAYVQYSIPYDACKEPSAGVEPATFGLQNQYSAN